VFHIKLQFTSEYPAGPPAAYFVTKLFHPNVAPRTGEVCVNTLKRDWNSKVTLSDILMVFQTLPS
jgi:ubiquitin-conjugating enzyme E2 S